VEERGRVPRLGVRRDEVVVGCCVGDLEEC
jgi:hypothetical protein